MDEFLKRFGEICEEVTGNPPPADLRPDTEFASLGVDSLSQLEMLTIMEEESGQRLPDYALRDVRTLREVYELVTLAPAAKEQ